MSLVNPDMAIWCQDFSTGFLDTPEPSTLADGATPRAANAFFANAQRAADGTRCATMRKRPGDTLMNATAMGAGAKVDGIAEFARIGATTELVAVCGGSAYVWSPGGGTWGALTGGAVFTAGQPARFLVFRNQLYIMDGTVTVRYDGTSCKVVGFACPTAAPALADGGASTLPAATYEGFAVWYDSATDHESSPSATSTPLVLAINRSRQWTKPTGAPPANVTHWRVYCRRVDTSEANFYRVGTVAVGTGTLTESVADLLRVDPGPAPNVNDTPAAAFAVMTTWKGYAIGWTPGATAFGVSKLGDAESWHPKDQLTTHGGGRDLRCGRLVRSGEVDAECILQTPTKTFRLVGDKMPFVPTEVGPSFGAVSQESGVEVGAYYYGWDEQKGPYRTDLGATWEPLATHRIDNLLATVNRAALANIRAEHDPTNHLVIWAVPLNGTTRCRALLCYHYAFDCWLPPITGLEYGCLARWTSGTGELALYMGDLWGRVYKLFSGTREGVPSGTLTAAITGAAAGTVTAATATFYTTGGGLAGMPVAVVSPSGEWQFRRIQSNTATQITLDTTFDAPWSTVPATDGTWTVVVGPIAWFWCTPQMHGPGPSVQKRGHHHLLDAQVNASATVIAAEMRVNDAAGATGPSWPFSMDIGGGGVWGVSLWGTGLWGAGESVPRRARIGRTFYSIQFRWANFWPDQQVTISGYGVTADVLRRRGGHGYHA